MEINTLIVVSLFLQIACFAVLIFHLDYFFRRILSLMETGRTLNTPPPNHDIRRQFKARVPKPENQV